MSVRLTGKPVEILLIEGNPGDARLVAEAFRKGKLPHKLYVARDGAEALTFLHQENQYANAPVPHLILLDLNLPKKSGREVLLDIKSNGRLKYAPVVVLTASEAEQDILMAYNLHANACVIKPLEPDRFDAVIRSIADFWLTTVRLPGLTNP